MATFGGTSMPIPLQHFPTKRRTKRLLSTLRRYTRTLVALDSTGAFIVAPPQLFVLLHGGAPTLGPAAIIVFVSLGVFVLLVAAAGSRLQQ